MEKPPFRVGRPGSWPGHREAKSQHPQSAQPQDQPSRSHRHSPNIAMVFSPLMLLPGYWVALLAKHESTNGGRCPTCSRWWRPVSVPCDTWKWARGFLTVTPTRTTVPPSRSAPETGATGRMVGVRELDFTDIVSPVYVGLVEFTALAPSAPREPTAAPALGLLRSCRGQGRATPHRWAAAADRSR